MVSINNTISNSPFPERKYLTPFQYKLLKKKLLRPDLPDYYRQRIEIMLLADAGETQTAICKTVGCCAATARHWIAMARSGQAHHWQNSPMGRPTRVNDQYKDLLKELVSRSPRDYGYSFNRWTAAWLSKHLAQELNIHISDRHVNRLLKEMGLSTRPKSLAQTDKDDSQTSSLGILIRDLSTSENQQKSG